MRILVTQKDSPERKVYFPEDAIKMLREIGDVSLNEKDEQYTPDELRDLIKNVDVCITHWGSPLFTKKVLENADRLGLIAHAAGSVADIVTDAVYEKGIKVCSANNIMAKYVAEGTLLYILAGLRQITKHDRDMKRKMLWERRKEESRGLFGEKIGLVGLGTIGMYLLDLLKPFDVRIKLYDPYISKNSLSKYPNVELDTLENVLAFGNIISLHSSLTSETRNMISRERLKLIKDNALFVNTARGAIVDEEALTIELENKRINAVLDVFKNEPLDINSRLRNMDNVILIPHMAGAPAREVMTYAMIEEIKRFKRGEPFIYEIPYEKYKLMTKENELR
jgi:Phosphoglycerate dehydrogenase and related dehydrogenases